MDKNHCSPRLEGREYERLAADFLSGLGYRIIRRNFFCRQGEIDIIASTMDTLVFVEVRARITGFVSPEESIDNKKIKRLTHTAEYYLMKHPWNGDIRFDLIAVSADQEQNPESDGSGEIKKIVHLKDII